MPAQNIHPSFLAPQQQIRPVQIQDLKGDPWLDPTAEPPLEESSVDAFFRHSMKEDFVIPPTLSEAENGRLCQILYNRLSCLPTIQTWQKISEAFPPKKI